MLPDYISKAAPNPAENRQPWYVNTAPTYAGIFLWIAFYKDIAGSTLTHAGAWRVPGRARRSRVAVLRTLLFCPGMLGMKTGFPLYVVGSSTFGTGRLRDARPADGTAADRMVRGRYLYIEPVHSEGAGNRREARQHAVHHRRHHLGLLMGYVGAKGIQYVSKVSTLPELHSAGHAARSCCSRLRAGSPTMQPPAAETNN